MLRQDSKYSSLVCVGMNHPETTKPQDKQSICLCSLRAAQSQDTPADFNVCLAVVHPFGVILDHFFSFSRGSPLNALIGMVATLDANLAGLSALQACHGVGWQELCKLQFI